MVIDEIAIKVRNAALNGQKIAMFHFQVLVNAEELKRIDPTVFCKKLGVPESFATEFRKMLSLARLMKEQGVKVKPCREIKENRMLMTHGGRKAKNFKWVSHNDFVTITKEKGRQEEYSLPEILAVLSWLTGRFGATWFPLANNVEKLWHDEEADGLGVAILRQQPRKIEHAQGSSYLGVVLEYAGILEWNKKMRGIEWRIIFQPQNLNELRIVMDKKTT